MAIILATKIVDGIIKDLTDRRGFRQEWDMCDKDIQKEIREAWIEIVDGEIVCGVPGG